jgi:hypothetical protein
MAKDKNLENIEKADEESSALIEWQSPDSLDVAKDNRVIMVVIGIGVGAIVYLGWQKIWTGVALVTLGLIMFAFAAPRKPKNVICAIYDEGVVADNMVHNFEDFKSFWIANGSLPKLILKKKGLFAPVVEMPLVGADVEGIVKLLSEKMPQEEDKGEDIVDMINRWLKF